MHMGPPVLTSTFSCFSVWRGAGMSALVSFDGSMRGIFGFFLGGSARVDGLALSSPPPRALLALVLTPGRLDMFGFIPLRSRGFPSS
ncbi:hypothetical protein LIER_30689 [Lithospermum erythrorhizon]|uniref:Secreted protein n=1 Tax=Lithospermum erythrorhizon TaxID=34254 RepID=A0AAV3RUB9_LITER